jgi:hypothetical protein
VRDPARDSSQQDIAKKSSQWDIAKVIGDRMTTDVEQSQSSAT